MEKVKLKYVKLEQRITVDKVHRLNISQDENRENGFYWGCDESVLENEYFLPLEGMTDMNEIQALLENTPLSLLDINAEAFKVKAGYQAEAGTEKNWIEFKYYGEVI